MQDVVLSPDPERLLGRTVGDREQRRFFPGGVGISFPGGTTNSSFGPHRALSRPQWWCHDLPHRRRRRRRSRGFLAFEALREQREVGAHGRQNRPAIDRSKYPPAEPGALVLEPLEAAYPCRTSQASLPLCGMLHAS